MPFEIVRQDITKMQVDAIVNPTSSYPFVGGGTDFMINEVAGPQLFVEREKFGHIEKTEAIMTKGYHLPAKHVIHVSGPIYIDGKHNEHSDLYQTYINALQFAKQHHLESIAFPLISTGTYQFPRGEALEVALSAIKTFLSFYDMYIYLVVYDDASCQLSLARFETIKNYIETEINDEEVYYHSFNSLFSEENYTIEEIISPSTRRSIENIELELDETFTESLFRLIDERELNDVEVYKRANIDRKLFSKIKSNNNYQPGKMTTLAFSIALELNLDQTKDLLNKAGYSLSPSTKFDKIIQYFIENRIYDLYEINQVLFAFEQKTIGGLD